MRILLQNALVLVLCGLPCLVFARKLAPDVEHAMAHGAEAEICLKVCDDEGAPVSNAIVRASLDMMPSPQVVYGKTDVNGFCVIRGKTNGNKISIRIGKDGYYGSRTEMSLIPIGGEHDVKDGKWQPYPTENAITLRMFRNPVQLVSQHGVYYFPTLRKWTAFDLMANDWVKPHGKGVVGDVEMQLDFEGEDPVHSKCQHFKIRFLGNALNGAYFVSSIPSSEYSLSYFADNNKRFTKEFLDENACTWKKFGMLDKTRDMVFRIRSVTDSKGNLVSCYYGRLKRIDYGVERTGIGAVVMSWQTNPTPNDTNLEDIEVAKRSRDFVRHCEPPSSEPNGE